MERHSAQAILAQKEITEWRMAELLARSTAEYTSIICSAALLSFGSITPSAGTSVHIRAVWTLAAVQAPHQPPAPPAACTLSLWDLFAN